jgi:hypothetical protein
LKKWEGDLVEYQYMDSGSGWCQWEGLLSWFASPVVVAAALLPRFIYLELLRAWHNFLHTLNNLIGSLKLNSLMDPADQAHGTES